MIARNKVNDSEFSEEHPAHHPTASMISSSHFKASSKLLTHRPSIFGLAAVPEKSIEIPGNMDAHRAAVRPKSISNQFKNPNLFGSDFLKKLGSSNLQGSIMYLNENLDVEDFLETEWVPPSVPLARESRKVAVFKGGSAPFMTVTMTESQDCGPGLTLYFQLVKSMTVVFFIMSILSIPAMLITSAGNNMAVEDQDVIGFYKFTLGNVGYNNLSPDYADLSSCGDGAVMGFTTNSTCISMVVAGNHVKLTTAVAALIITTFEFIQVVVYLLGVFYIWYKYNTMTQTAANSSCNVSNFTVIVRNIPPSTELQDLVDHFSGLYQLSERDFNRRPPLFGARPVEFVENSGYGIFRNTWLADACIFRKIGALIRAYKNDAILQEELYRSRALMKMYGKNSAHAEGYIRKEFMRAKRKMLKVAKRIDENTNVLLHHYTLREGYRSSKLRPTHLRVEDTLEADAVCAHVIFNYSESMARCIEDYSLYGYWPFSQFYPEKLKLKGSKIAVSRAVEPDDIIWENIEIPLVEKRTYRLINALLSSILLLAGFYVILQSTAYHVRFSKELPDFNLCQTEIPAVYSWKQGLPGYSTALSRHGTKQSGLFTTELDSACQRVLPGSFYAAYTINGNDSDTLAQYDFSRCSRAAYMNSSKVHANQILSNQFGECPHYNQTAFCPCVTLSGTETCSSLGCTLRNHGLQCLEFPSYNIAGCYCYQYLTSVLFSLLGNEAKQILSGDLAVCYNFYQNYLTAFSLTYASSFSTTVTNTLLKYFFVVSTKYEYQDDTDSERSSLFYKIFSVIYLNMAFVVLAAYGYLKDSPDALRETFILQGAFEDYSASWYGQVGSYLCLTFILSGPVPYLYSLPDFLVFAPLRRWSVHRRVVQKTQRIPAMQCDLDALQYGPVFNYTESSAFVVAMIFFAMTYAPGLPILMPILFAFLGLYFVIDKWLVLRYFHKPAHSGGGLTQTILSLLPLAAIVRLCNACWMYGNTDILPSSIVNIGFLFGLTSTSDPVTAAANYNQYVSTHAVGTAFYVVAHISRTNVFPLFVLLSVVVGFVFIRFIWRELPIYWIIRVIDYAARVSSLERVQEMTTSDGYIHGVDMLVLGDRNRAEMAPYTEAYFKYTRKVGAEPPLYYRMLQLHRFYNWNRELSDEEKEDGWLITEIDGYYAKIKKWKKNRFRSTGSRFIGMSKRTYEVVEENGCSSYHLEQIPGYALAIASLKEGARNLRESMLKVTEFGEIMGSVAARFNENQSHKLRESTTEIDADEESLCERLSDYTEGLKSFSFSRWWKSSTRVKDDSVIPDKFSTPPRPLRKPALLGSGSTAMTASPLSETRQGEAAQATFINNFTA